MLIAIIIPVSILCRITVNSRFQALKDEVRINNAIDTATQDAIDQIITVSNFDYDIEFGDVINITPALAMESINTFFHTLAVNYNIPFKYTDMTSNTQKSSDSYIKNYFSSYVPAVIIIAYDGFYVYSQELTSGGYEYKLSSKIPYTYNANNYSIGYTLKNDVYLYYNNNCYSGRLYYNKFSDIVAKFNSDYKYIADTKPSMQEAAHDISMLTDDISMVIYALNNCPNNPSSITIGKELMPTSSSVNNFSQDYQTDASGKTTVGDFHKKRREVIIKIISDTLTETINIKHNKFAELVGNTYNFYLPEITDDDWINSINDITVMSFVQGIPVGTLKGNYYNNYALGGSQIVNRGLLYGNTVKSDYSNNNVNLYHKDENCKGITEHINVNTNKKEYDQIFISEYGSNGAIENNYLPCQLCN